MGGGGGRVRHNGDLGVMTLSAFSDQLKTEIEAKK
jgi:hypothetical protein